MSAAIAPVARMISNLEEFLSRLERSRIHFQLARVRAGHVMVQIAVPGERWEVEFGEQGQVEVEVFRSDGAIPGSEALLELFRRFEGAG